MNGRKLADIEAELRAGNTCDAPKDAIDVCVELRRLVGILSEVVTSPQCGGVDFGVEMRIGSSTMLMVPADLLARAGDVVKEYR